MEAAGIEPGISLLGIDSANHKTTTMAPRIVSAGEIGLLKIWSNLVYMKPFASKLKFNNRLSDKVLVKVVKVNFTSLDSTLRSIF